MYRRCALANKDCHLHAGLLLVVARYRRMSAIKVVLLGFSQSSKERSHHVTARKRFYADPQFSSTSNTSKVAMLFIVKNLHFSGLPASFFGKKAYCVNDLKHPSIILDEHESSTNYRQALLLLLGKDVGASIDDCLLQEVSECRSRWRFVLRIAETVRYC